MMKEVSKSIAKSTEVRKKSPGRPRSPSRKAAIQKSPEPKPQETIKNTKEKSAGTKTPERTKSPSRRPKSPSRRNKSPTKVTKDKSPSRPKRTKSPARTKSPSRVSPARSLTKESSVILKRISLQTTKLELDSGSEEEFLPKQKPSATVKGLSRKFELEEMAQPTIKPVQNIDSFNSYTSEVRRITRNSKSQDRVVHLKNFDVVSKKGEFSDDELTPSDLQPSSKQEGTSVREFLSLLWNIFFAPGFVIGIYLLCNQSKCTWGSLPDWRKFLSLSYFFDLQSFLGYSAVAVLVALLSALPIGGTKVTSLPGKQPKFVYNINGLFVLAVVISCFVALEYLGFNNTTFIVNNLFHLCISAALYATLCSIILYIKSFYAPITALSSTQIESSFLNGFFFGREISPRFGNVLDFKIYLLRLYSITMVLVNGSLLYKGLELDGKLGPAIRNLDWKPFMSHPTLLLIVAFHLIYFIGHLVYEARGLSTYFIQYEAPGFATNIAILMYPFQLITQSMYILQHRVHYPTWELVLATIIFVIGYAIFTVSNNQKDAFRKNPYSAVASKFESIPTSTGKKILCSGCWGVVRQPNMTGDILIHVALLRFGLDAYPVLAVLSIIYMLIERAQTSQADCKGKYGSAWDKYCQKVKYILIPKVY